MLLVIKYVYVYRKYFRHYERKKIITKICGLPYWNYSVINYYCCCKNEIEYYVVPIVCVCRNNIIRRMLKNVPIDCFSIRFLNNNNNNNNRLIIYSKYNSTNNNIGNDRWFKKKKWISIIISVLYFLYIRTPLYAYAQVICSILYT